jgi:ATP-dependent Lon protease
VQEALRRERPIGILLQRAPETEDPVATELHSVGTIGERPKYVPAPTAASTSSARGSSFSSQRVSADGAFFIAKVEVFEENEELEKDKEVEARFLHLKEQAKEALSSCRIPAGVGSALQAVSSASTLADMVSTYLDIPTPEKQEILETFEVKARLDRVSAKLAHRLEVLRLSKEISNQTRGSMEKAQREYYLREQLKTIQKELGEGDTKSVEIRSFPKRSRRLTCRRRSRRRR